MRLVCFVRNITRIVIETFRGGFFVVDSFKDEEYRFWYFDVVLFLVSFRQFQRVTCFYQIDIFIPPEQWNAGFLTVIVVCMCNVYMCFRVSCLCFKCFFVFFSTHAKLWKHTLTLIRFAQFICIPWVIIQKRLIKWLCYDNALHFFFFFFCFCFQFSVVAVVCVPYIASVGTKAKLCKLFRYIEIFAPIFTQP